MGKGKKKAKLKLLSYPKAKKVDNSLLFDSTPFLPMNGHDEDVKTTTYGRTTGSVYAYGGMDYDEYNQGYMGY